MPGSAPRSVALKLSMTGTHKESKSNGPSPKKGKNKMKVTAVTRFKQGDLYNALKKLGWTQAELAKRTGLGKRVVGDAINLRRKPSSSNLDRIQKVLGDAGEYLDVTAIWPDNFKGFQKSVVIEQTNDVELLLPGMEPIALHDSMKPDFESARQLIEKALGNLSEKEAEVVKERYFDGKLFQEIGGTINRTAPSEICKRALRKLRRSSPMKLLREAKDCIS